MNGEQMKAGRLLLGWSQSRLAALSGVSQSSIAVFETGGRTPSMLQAIKSALTGAGVVFIDGESPGAALGGRTANGGATLDEGALPRLSGEVGDRYDGAPL